MTDIEREIATFLHEEADRATLPEGMDQRILHRAKSRRSAKVVVLAVAVLATVMAGSVMAGAFRSSPKIVPVGPPSPAEMLPDESRGGPEVVARGEIAGQWWTLTAYESEAGLCEYFEMANGSTGGCHGNGPESRDLFTSTGYIDGLSRSIVHGVVSDRVVTLSTVVEGERKDVEIVDGVDRFGVNFFVAFVPVNAEGGIEARDHDSVVDADRIVRATDAFPPRCYIGAGELPSGATTGDARIQEGAYGEMRVWGRGSDRVALLAEIPPELGLPDPSDLPSGDPQRVVVRENDGVVVPVGDPPASQIILAWRDGECSYTVWLGPGLDLDAAIGYASRF